MQMTRKLFCLLLAISLLILSSCSGCSFLHRSELPSAAAAEEASEKESEEEKKEESPLLVYSSGEIREICRIQLSAERTDFYENEDGTFSLTVTLPDGSLLQDVELRLSYGDNTQSAGVIHVEEFQKAEDGMLSVTKTMSLHTDRCGKYELQAFSGEYRSSVLSLFTTPHITMEQVLESAQIGSDLSTELSEKYDENVSSEELASAAEEYLKKDSRVAETERVGTKVYYSTTASVAGMFNAEAQDPEVLSSEGTRDFDEKTMAVNTFENYGSGVSTVDPSGNPILLDSGNTTTNGNTLILRPATNAMKDIQMGQLESAANKIQSKADGVTADHKKDTSAVVAIFNRDILNYGTVFLQTHGGTLEKDGEQCAVSFLIYQTSTFTESGIKDKLEKELDEYARAEFRVRNGREGTDQEIEEEFARNFYGKTGEQDSWRLYTAHQRDWENTVGIRCVGQIQMSSAYIMERYADRNFDNTVFYIGACFGFSHMPFNEWLIERGCREVLGYTNSVNLNMSLLDVNDLFDQLMKESASEKWRLESVGEAAENKENPVLNLIENIAQEGLRKISSWAGKADEMYYIGSDDFFYTGTGTIRGKVYYSYEENPSPEDLKPASGINVRSFLFLNQEFTEKTSAVSGEDGSFELPEMRSGLYVLQAEVPDSDGKLVSVILDEEKTKEGKIILPSPPIVDVILENEDRERITDAQVGFTDSDGTTTPAMLTNAGGDTTFRAKLSEKTYEIEVIPNDDYIPTSVSYTIPSGYPRRHIVTVTLEKYCTVSGMVSDEETSEPLSGVVVTVSGTNGESSAVSENGLYTVKELLKGDYTITFEADGYETQSLTATLQGKTALSPVYMKRSDERGLLLQYLNEVLIPEYGTADGVNALIKNMASYAAYNEVYDQLNNRILGSMIADFDQDSHPEMVTVRLSFREDPDPSNMYPLVHYTISYYDVKDGKVREVDSIDTEAAAYYTVGHFMTVISGNPYECNGGPRQDPGIIRLVTASYGWDEYSSTMRQVTAWSFTEDSIEYDFGASSTGANQHSWMYRLSENGEKTIAFESKQDTAIAGDYGSYQEAFEQEFTIPLSEIGLEDFMSGAFLASPSNLQEYTEKTHFVSYVDTEKDGTVYTERLQEYIASWAEN